jgi:hypothetical protein
LKIETDNAAFECDGLQGEISRILHDAADKINGGGRYGSTLRDINGNAVGYYHFIAPAPAADAHLMADYDENNGDNAPLDYEPENGGNE